MARNSIGVDATFTALDLDYEGLRIAGRVCELLLHHTRILSRCGQQRDGTSLFGARLGVENAKTIKPGQAVKESGEWSIMFNSKARNAINWSGADKSKRTFSFVPN
jgi:hypothetical protein